MPMTLEGRARLREAVIASNRARKGVPKPNHKPRYTKSPHVLAEQSAKMRARHGLPPLVEPDPVEVVRLWDDGVLQGDIARLLNASRTRVKAVLDEAGIGNRRHRRRRPEALSTMTTAQRDRRTREGGSFAGRMRERFGDGRGMPDGHCTICGREGPVVRDHDHRTMTPRDWLCWRCNVGLGYFDEEPDRIATAAEYLRAHART